MGMDDDEGSLTSKLDISKVFPSKAVLSRMFMSNGELKRS
jgi:hypothetical protein